MISQNLIQSLPNTNITSSAFCANGDVIFVTADGILYKAVKQGTSFSTPVQLKTNIDKLSYPTVNAATAMCAVLHKRVGTGTANTYTATVEVFDLTTATFGTSFTVTGMHPTNNATAGINPTRNSVLFHSAPRFLEFSIADGTQLYTTTGNVAHDIGMYVGNNRFISTVAGSFFRYLNNAWSIISASNATTTLPAAYGDDFFISNFISNGGGSGSSTYGIHTTLTFTVTSAVKYTEVRNLEYVQYNNYNVTYLPNFTNTTAVSTLPSNSLSHYADGRWYNSTIRHVPVLNGTLLVEETYNSDIAPYFFQTPVACFEGQRELKAVAIRDNQVLVLFASGACEIHDKTALDTEELAKPSTFSMSLSAKSPITLQVTGTYSTISYDSANKKLRLVDIGGTRNTSVPDRVVELEFDNEFTNLVSSKEYVSPIEGTVNTLGFKAGHFPNNNGMFDSTVPVILKDEKFYHHETGELLVAGMYPSSVAEVTRSVVAICPDTKRTLIQVIGRQPSGAQSSSFQRLACISETGEVLYVKEASWYKSLTGYNQNYYQYTDGCVIKPKGNGIFEISNSRASYYNSQYPNLVTSVTYNTNTDTATYYDYTAGRNDIQLANKIYQIFSSKTRTTFHNPVQSVGRHSYVSSFGTAYNGTASLYDVAHSTLHDRVSFLYANDETQVANGSRLMSLYSNTFGKDMRWYVTGAGITSRYIATVSKHGGEYPKSAQLRMVDDRMAVLVEAWPNLLRVTPIRVYGKNDPEAVAGTTFPIIAEVRRMLARLAGWVTGG